ncbi:MAG: lipoyl(octanoyl) transferase LipB [Candidatus Pacearchaeota archaeon]
MNLELKVLDWGRTDYERAFAMQMELFKRRRDRLIVDHLVLTEHEPVITLGANNQWNKVHVTEEVAKQNGVGYVQSDRGGGTAYLGPGQLVGYTIMNIGAYGGVLPFMKMLEETMIKTSEDFGIKVERRDTHNPTTDKPYRATWYMGDGKPKVLCTKGIKVAMSGSGMYTHHGFALNVNRPEINYFHFVDQCGFPATDVEPVYMSDIVGGKLNWEEVKSSVARNFSLVFNKKQEVPICP